MNAVPLEVQPTSLGLLLALFVFALLLPGAIAFLRLPVIRSRFPAIMAMLAAFLLCGAVVMFFWSFSGVSIRTISPAPPATPRTLTPSLFTESPEAEPPTVASPPLLSADGSTKNALPEWTTHSPVLDGKRKLVVLNGGRFASEEEAELHAFDQATLIATQQFRHLDPQGIGRRLEIHRDEIRRTAIKQRFLEVREHDFGKSKGLMYQVWLQMELSENLGQRLAAPWRQAAVDARVRTLAACGIWLTAVAGLISFAFRWT